MKIKKIIGFLVIAALSSNSQATDLIDAYWQAVKNDPTFRAAKSQLQANQEVIKQAKSGLWPILTTSTSKALFNSTRNETITTTGGSAAVARNKPRSINVTITQPIFTYETYARIKEAKATVRKAVADYQASQQDLMIRVANTYLDVLEAQDTLAFTMSEKKAIARQLDQAKQRYKVGLDAITSVYDAQASYDAVISREITAQNDLRNRLETLGEITGQTYGSLVTIRENLPLQRPEPDNIDTWVRSALRFNKTLLSARADVDIAREQVSVAKGAMIPTLNLVASYDNSEANDFGFGNSSVRAKQIGLSVDVPVFQGGRLLSEANQAGHNLNTTVAQLDATVKSTVSRTRQSYNSILSGIGAVSADRQAVKSSQSSLDSTEAAFKVGTRTMVDVLDKQRDLFDVKRRLASDQYNFIKEVLRLKLAAGLLNIADLEEINSWLRGPTAHTTTERFKPTKHEKLLGPMAEKYEPIVLADREFMTDFRALGIKRPYLLNVANIHAPMKIYQGHNTLAQTSQISVTDSLKDTYDTIEHDKKIMAEQAIAEKQAALQQAQLNATPIVERRPMRHNLALYLVDKELAKLLILKPTTPTKAQREAMLAEMRALMKESSQPIQLAKTTKQKPITIASKPKQKSSKQVAKKQLRNAKTKLAHQGRQKKKIEILLGSYKKKTNVNELSSQVKAITGKKVIVTKRFNKKHQTIYQVKLVPEQNIKLAKQLESDLHNAGLETAVIKWS